MQPGICVAGALTVRDPFRREPPAFPAFLCNQRFQSGTHERRFFFDPGKITGSFQQIVVNDQGGSRMYDYASSMHISAAASGRRPMTGWQGAGAGERVLTQLFDPVILDHGITQNVARNGLQILTRIERDLKKFALSDIFDSLMPEAVQRGANSLALGVEDGLLERDVDACFH
jgi:hypothetical protein